MNPTTPPPFLPANTFIVLGPTAVGKSELAVQVAERAGGEIIGADAFQVYAGLDLLSAAPSAEQKARARHHLVGELPLTAALDVARYRALAMERIGEVAGRGKVPVICGGAGLYARALTHGLAEMPPGDPEIRAALQQEPLEALVKRLRELDPASTVDEKNPRRVIRALEVCLASGRPFSSFRAEWQATPPIRGVILTRPRELLLERIAARVEAMFASGVVEEVRRAGEIGSTASQMLGLREIQALVAGRMRLDDCKAAIILATRQYAKRQMTWFRREEGYRWIDLDSEPNALEAILASFDSTQWPVPVPPAV